MGVAGRGETGGKFLGSDGFAGSGGDGPGFGGAGEKRSRACRSGRGWLLGGWQGHRGVGQDPGAAARQAYDASALEICARAGFGQDAVAPVSVKALETGEQMVEMAPRHRNLHAARTAPRRDVGGNDPQSGQEGGEEEA